MAAPHAAPPRLATGPELRNAWPALAAKYSTSLATHPLANPPYSSNGRWLLWCFDYAYYRLCQRNLAPFPHGIGANQLRQGLGHFRYRLEFEFPTLAKFVVQYQRYRHNVNSNFLLSGDVFIMGGTGGGGHAVWINEFRLCDHLLQCQDINRQMKPIPAALILELESQRINSTLFSRNLPNLRCHQSVDSMLAMCQNDMHLPFELWRSSRQPDFCDTEM